MIIILILIGVVFDFGGRGVKDEQGYPEQAIYDNWKQFLGIVVSIFGLLKRLFDYRP
jgi:hypothetical protein